MLEILGWINVEKFLYVHTMIFVYKIVNNILPEYMKRQLLPASVIHTRNPRMSKTSIFISHQVSKVDTLNQEKLLDISKM